MTRNTALAADRRLRDPVRSARSVGDAQRKDAAGLADDGDDADGLLSAALEAPRFLNLVDESTLRHVAEARLRRNGFDASLDRSRVVADAHKHLGDTLDAAVASFGAPGDRPAPLRTLPDGSSEPIP